MTPASFRLIVRTGPNPGMVCDLAKEVSLLGRDVTNDIVLADAEVSRQHARLTRTPGGYVLEDLGSTNGTFVNGERLIAPRVLNPGDLVGFGENVTLTFDAASPESAATVMSPAAGYAAEPPPREQAPVYAPATPGVAAPLASTAEPSGSRTWIFAGVGCLALVIACFIFFFLMDRYAPDILYAPLKLLGF